MNLFQISEDIKGLPLQVVMSYANGKNPQVPPYVALAELNRRKEMQGGAPQQSGMPQQSVAEKVKEEAGVMAQQQAQQAQQQQQMQQGVGQIPTPSDVFTDRGMAGGGIVGFADGGSTDDALPPYTLDQPGLPYLIRFLKSLKADSPQSTPEAIRAMQQRDYELGNTKQPPPPPFQPNAAGDPRQGSYVPFEGDAGPVSAAPAPQAATPDAAPVTPQARSAGIAALASAPKATPTAATEPAYKQGPWADALMKILGRAVPQSSDADNMAQFKSLLDEFNIKAPEADPGGRIAAMRADEAKRQALIASQQKDRGVNNLIAMATAYAQAPRYRSSGAAGAEYGRLTDAQQTADSAQADHQRDVAIKLADLDSINEQRQQAFNAGNLSLYLKRDNESKQRADEVLKLQATTGAHMAGIDSGNQNNLQTERERSASQERIAAGNNAATLQHANILAGSRNNPATLLPKYLAIREKIASDVESADSKNNPMQAIYKANPSMPEAKAWKTALDAKIEERLAPVKAAMLRAGMSPEDEMDSAASSAPVSKKVDPLGIR